VIQNSILAAIARGLLSVNLEPASLDLHQGRYLPQLPEREGQGGGGENGRGGSEGDGGYKGGKNTPPPSPLTPLPVCFTCRPRSIARAIAMNVTLALS